MNSLRKLKAGWVLLVLIALATSQAGAQWVLPADYDKSHDAQNPADLRGGKGRGMVLLYYESFEAVDNVVKSGWGKVPKGWSQEVQSLNPSGATSFWDLRNGGGSPGDKAFTEPGHAYDGKQNAVCHGRTTLAQQRLVTPMMDLSQSEVVNGDPRLVFYYASPESYNGFCRLRLQYRIGGEHNEWHDIPHSVELRREENWTQVSVRLPQEIRKNKLQLGFLSMQNNGYGTSIDEVYVVNMVSAKAPINAFDCYPESPMVARGAKRVPLMRIDVLVGPGGGKQKLVGLSDGGKKIMLSAYDPKRKVNLSDALSDFKLYVGQGRSFSTAVEAAAITTTGGSGVPYSVTRMTVTNHNALIMYGGNTYNLWIVADVAGGEEVPYKSRLWVDVDEQACKFAWLTGSDSETTMTSSDESRFPAAGHPYKTPEEQRTVVYKRLFFDDFESSGTAKWKFPTETNGEQLWAVGNPAYNKDEYTKANKQWREEQVTAAYSGSKVLATGELLGNSWLRARYFERMTTDEKTGPGLWIERDEEIDASNVKGVYLTMQKSFNTPYGMVLIVEGKYAEQGSQWMEFARYALSSADWTSWQPMSLRLAKADGRKFRLRLRVSFPHTDLSHTGLIIDDLELLGDEVQDDVGITALNVSDSWSDGTGRKVSFKVHNYGKNAQKGMTYEVFIDGKRVGSAQQITGEVQPGQDLEVKSSESYDEQLRADIKKDNTHYVEVRLKLDTDEDLSNNRRGMSIYSYPTIEVSDEKFYPSRFGEQMLHWFGKPYKEGYSSTWISNTVYNISKCRGTDGTLSGRFGAGMLLGSYIWTTGDHQALGYEQSVLESPIFEISTKDRPKEFVMAYASEGDHVLFRVEYRTESQNDWKPLEKSTVWENGWYGNGGTSTPADRGWKGSVSKYTIVKTQLPDELQGKTSTVKVQFRIYFFNNAAERTGGLAINGVEVRPMRADLTITSHTPEGGCGHPLKNDQTLKIKIKNQNKPAVVQESMTLPVAITVVRGGQTYREVKLAQLPQLQPGAEWEFDTEIQLPWGAESGVSSQVDAELLPQSSDLELADEDVGNNKYSKAIEAVVPGVFPLKEIVEEGGKYMLYTSQMKELTLLDKPYDEKQYKGYTFSDFSIESGDAASVESGNKFKVKEFGTVTLKYKVGADCEMKLPIEIKEQKCDMAVESVAAVGTQNCKDEGESLSFTVKVKNYVMNSSVTPMLVVTQGGRELYRQGATVGNNTVVLDGQDPSKRVRNGGGRLKFTVVAEADMDGSNNTREYDKDILLYPKPLTVYLQDIQDPSYMRLAKSDTQKGENTYGTREWQLYVPKMLGVEEIKWEWKGQPMPGEDKGHVLKLGYTSGVLRAKAGLSYGSQTCPEKEVFAVKINNQDIEVLGLGGSTGLPSLCADAEGGYSLYVGVMNHSRMTYETGCELGFELSSASGDHKHTVIVKLSDNWNSNVLRQLSLGKLPRDLWPAGGAATVQLQVKYLGRYLDLEHEKIEEDAYAGNNTRTTELKLSEAPVLKWVGIQKEQSGEYIVRKVFGGSGVTTELAVDDSGVSGISYEWYSKSNGANEWIALSNTGTQPGMLQIVGVPDDCYKVEATNLSGCKAELDMRYIQTDVSFDEINPVLRPTATCRLTENPGEAVLQLKNTGSKPLTNKEKFKVSCEINGHLYESKVLTFNGFYMPGDRIEVIVSDWNLTQDLLDSKSGTLTMQDLRLQVEGDWSVTGNDDVRKSVTAVLIQEKGVPQAQVYLLKETKAQDFTKFDSNSEKLLEPKGGIKSGDFPSLANTYGPLLGYVKKSKGDKAEWKWRYQSNQMPDIKINPADNHGDSVAVFPQDLQLQYMKDNIPTFGWMPGTAKQPKNPDGTYTVVVSDKNNCESSIRFSVADRSYDIELKSLTAPQSSCDLSQGDTRVTVLVRNAGTMPVSKDAELKLTLKREDVNNIFTTDEEKKAYQAFTASDEGKPEREVRFKVGEKYLGKDLEPDGIMQVSIPVTLYKEYEHPQGVKRSLFDGKSFKYTAQLEFVDKRKYNEVNMDNNKTVSPVTVEDHLTPRVKTFTVKGKNSPVFFNGEGGFFIRKPDEDELLQVSIDCEPADVVPTWWLRNELQDESGKTKVEGNNNQIKVKGLGGIDVVLSSSGGCTGRGSLQIMGEGQDLVVKSVKEGLPEELCPEGVAGKRTLKVMLQNLSPVPINTSDANKPCGQGSLTAAKLKLTLTDMKDPSNKVVKEFKPEELYGAPRKLTMSEWWVDPSTQIGGWRETPNSAVSGVGLSGLDSLEVAIEGFELNAQTWSAGASGSIKVEIEGGCESTNSTRNNTYMRNLSVRQSPDMSGVLVNDLKFYVKRGETKHWEEQWRTSAKLQRVMEWGEEGAQLGSITARADTPGALTLPLEVSKSGMYTLKVKDDLGCAAQKTVKVQLPGFLALSGDAVQVGPKSLLEGSCSYDKSTQTLLVTVTNEGNEPLVLASKRLQVKVKQQQEGKPAGAAKSFDYTFKGDVQALPVGEAVAVELSDQFRQNVDLREDGTYTLEFELATGVNNPVDEADESLRGGSKSVKVKRFYQPVGTIDLAKQVKSVYSSHADLNFRKLPKSPEKWKLYGLVSYPNAGSSPSGAEFTKLVDNGTKWTWYVDGEAQGEASPFGFEKEFSGLEPYGKVQVKLETRDGCQLESEPVEMYRLREYTFAPFTLRAMSSKSCADKNSTAGTEQNVSGTFTLAKADGVLKAGSQIKVTCQYTVTDGQKQVLDKKELTISLDKDYREGDAIPFEIKVPFKVGENSVQMTGGRYVDPISGEEWRIPPRNAQPMVFTIKAGPSFKGKLEEKQRAEEKPYTIQIPEVEPGIPGETITYNWDQGMSRERDFQVSQSRAYSLVVTEQNGCELNATIDVAFYYGYTFDPALSGGGVLEVLDVADGTLYKPGERTIKDMTKVKLMPRAESGYEVVGVTVDGVPYDYAQKEFEVKDNFKVSAEFRQQQKQNPDAVESDLLRGVVAVNPFTRLLRLYGASNVASYVIYNPLGSEVRRGVHVSGAEELAIDASSLHDGVYVVWLRDVSGGERVLRVVKASD